LGTDDQLTRLSAIVAEAGGELGVESTIGEEQAAVAPSTPTPAAKVRAAQRGAQACDGWDHAGSELVAHPRRMSLAQAPDLVKIEKAVAGPKAPGRCYYMTLAPFYSDVVSRPGQEAATPAADEGLGAAGPRGRGKPLSKKRPQPPQQVRTWTHSLGSRT
jgi:hypothetical protein